ncbi:MAG: diguanylate cyclase [Leptolinea sp.]
MKKPTILIVEDDAILVMHLEKILTRQGYTVLRPAATGENAIEDVQNQRPDLVLMDIELAGEMNGITAAQEILAATDTPVIFLTGYSQDILLQKAKVAAPYGFLVKPVPERELTATIEIALYKHQIDHQIKLSETKYRSLVEQASDGIFLADPAGNYLEVNSAGCEMLGYTRAEILQLNMRDLIVPVEQAASLQDMSEMCNRSVVRIEQVFVRKDGTHFPVEISGKILEDGSQQDIVRDITERKAAEVNIRLLNIELEQLAVTDYLTNLYNRRYFMQRGMEEVKRANRNSQPLALLMMDIDHFKKINDTSGHAAGDLALQQVAATMKTSLREIDILGRMGGEEFAVLLPNTPLADAALLAERIRHSIENMTIQSPGELLISAITISIGVAALTDGILNIDGLLRNADAAMYRAKHNGRNCVEVY